MARHEIRVATAPLKTRFARLKNTGAKDRRRCLGVFIHIGGSQGHGDPIENAVRTNTGDKIAGATGAYLKLRAERKLDGSAEAPAPQRPHSVFIQFGGP